MKVNSPLEYRGPWNKTKQIAWKNLVKPCYNKCDLNRLRNFTWFGAFWNLPDQSWWCTFTLTDCILTAKCTAEMNPFKIQFFLKRGIFIWIFVVINKPVINCSAGNMQAYIKQLSILFYKLFIPLPRDVDQVPGIK